MKFEYNYKTKNGRTGNAIIEASSKKEAIKKIESTNNFILNIKKVRSSPLKRKNNKFILLFTKNFSSLIKAGLSVNEVLEIIYKQHQESIEKNIIGAVIKDIKSGLPISESLKKHPTYFNDYFCAIVGAGEANGFLHETFFRLYEYLSYKATIRKKVITSLVYPMFLLSFSLLVIVFLSIFVLPSFAKIYNTYDENLPLITELILKFSNFVKNNWSLIIIVVLFLCLAFVDLLKKEEYRENFDSFLLKNKYISNLIYIKNISSFFSILSLSIRSGMPIIQALKIAQKTLTNQKIKNDINFVISSVARGERLSSSLQQINFPLVSIHLINAGETSNELEDIFDELVEYYHQEYEQFLNIFISFLEPILIILIGFIISIIILAVILPILRLSSVVG